MQKNIHAPTYAFDNIFGERKKEEEKLDVQNQNGYIEL